jgi:hypothetical protein
MSDNTVSIAGILHLSGTTLNDFFSYVERMGALDERLSFQRLTDLQDEFWTEHERRLEHMGHDPEKYIH